MIRYVVLRPIAVGMLFFALLLMGFAALQVIPISLLPDVQTPRITIRAQYPNTPAAALEQRVTALLRENLLPISGLRDIQSKTTNHTTRLHLYFDYGTRMDRAFMEVNEKIDRLSSQLPRDMERPQVIRIHTSDIPVMRLQITPRQGIPYQAVSALAEKTIKKRIEQVTGVSLVDIHGTQHTYLEIKPYTETLHALGLTEQTLIAYIQRANQELGSLSVRDGQYRYYLRVRAPLQGVEELAPLPIPLPDGNFIPLIKLAALRSAKLEPSGYHLFNGQEGIVLTIHKQSQAQMDALATTIRSLIQPWKDEFPDAHFDLTQDQVYLLDAGINNLYQSLVVGGILAVGILFLFIGNLRTPLLMGISIPISLIITFVLFYALDISLNIISLSGLALGIGMLIDNVIIVLDHITRKRSSGYSKTESCVQGTREVVTPVISQVLTTVAVYAPLVLLSGLAGALIRDQAIALTIALGVSLLVAFVLSPTLYRVLLHKEPKESAQDTRFFRWILRGYHQFMQWIFKYKYAVLAASCLVGLAGIWMAAHIPVTALPGIEKRESLLRIDWNAPIDARENLHRTKNLDAFLKNQGALVREADAGIPQFLLDQGDFSVTQGQVYYACRNAAAKKRIDQEVRNWLSQVYPQALYQLADAPNAFTQLFVNDAPYFEVRFQPLDGFFSPEDHTRLEALLHAMPAKDWTKGENLAQTTILELVIDAGRMAQYGINWSALHDQLNTLFGQNPITEIKRFGTLHALRFPYAQKDIFTQLQTTIPGINGTAYPLHTILRVEHGVEHTCITSNKSGPYTSIAFNHPTRNYAQLKKTIATLASSYGFSTTFTGTYISNQEHTGQLFKIFLVSLLLLYFILAIQFEHLLHPLLVLSTLPMGIFGSMVFLHLHHVSLDLMAGMGFVVVLGIITDDPILKIHTINRLRRAYAEAGYSPMEALEKAIYDAGEICLKPVLMTTLTTVLALIPMLFSSGIGTELQKTMVLVIAGGLSVGTFFTLCFVPLAYWITAKK